jgi:hypothetical protein
MMGNRGGYVIPNQNITNNYNMTVNQAGRVVDTAGMFAEMRAKVS